MPTWQQRLDADGNIIGMSAGGGSYAGCLGPGQQQAPQQAPHTRARGSGTPREAGASLGPMKVAMTHRNILPAYVIRPHDGEKGKADAAGHQTANLPRL